MIGILPDVPRSPHAQLLATDSAEPIAAVRDAFCVAAEPLLQPAYPQQPGFGEGVPW